MVVDQFNIKGIIHFKTENDAPIGPHRHGPQALQIAFERMQAIAGEIQSLRCRGRIENRENSFNRSKRSGRIPLRSPRS
jgi:hypothetical protein